MKSYQLLLETAIRQAQKEPKGFDVLMVEVFETFMKLEREMFLEKSQNKKEEKNKGNGFYERYIPSFHGALHLKVPRDRLGVFKPLMLEVARKQSDACSELAIALYTKGLSTRSVEEIIRPIFGERMSPSKVSELAQRLQPIREAWQQRLLSEEYFAIQIDAIRLHVRRETVYHEACFVVMGIKPDGRREILGLYLFPEEGSHAWREVFQNLIDRGLKKTSLVISDELTGIIDAVHEYYPSAQHQICLVHRKRNLINHIRSDQKQAFSDDFNTVFALDDMNNSLEAIEVRLESFIKKWKKSLPKITTSLEADKLQYYAAFLHFPFQVRRMIYTTNWIERLNRQIRKVTKRVAAFPSPDSLLNLVYMAIDQFQKGSYNRHIPAFYQYVKPLYEQSCNPIPPNPDTIF